MKNNIFVSVPRLLVRIVLSTVVFGVALANSALAQDWQFEPIVKVGGVIDDNATLRIRTDEEVELTGYLLDAKADINYSSPTTSFFVQPRALLRNFDESEFDSDDLFLRTNFRHQGTSNTIGFRVNFDRQSVRTAERSDSDLEIEDPDEITNDDTGRVLLSGTRNKWRLTPYWNYRLSSVSSIGADIDYFNARYDDIFSGLLRDYSDARLNLGYRRSLSNVTTGLITLTSRSYDSARSLDNINGYGVSAGFERTLSEKTRFKAMIGMEDTDQSGVESDPEVVGQATLIRDLETIRMFAQYRRSVNASGAGRLTVRDSLNLNFKRRLNEKISAGLGVRAYQSTGASGFTSIEDRNHIQFQSTFVWYLSTSFVIEADYRYTVLDRSAALGERSNSNRVGLWFVYQPKTIPKI